MSETYNIEKVKERISHIEDILASVAAGDMDARVNSETEDDLSGIEAAIDLLIDDLTDELKQREKMQKEVEDKLIKIQEQQKTIFSTTGRSNGTFKPCFKGMG